MELSTAWERPTGSGQSPSGGVMKWAVMYFFGFALLIGGVLAALWKLGILQNIETTWIVIGVVILAGVGIMISIASSGSKQNIEIDHE
jgi:hypothetical protein